MTNGHLDIVTRASRLYDEVVVAVGLNKSKSRLFTVDDRLDMLRAVTADLANVRVDSFSGLLVHYCRAHDIPVVVKGLRAVTDFDFELQMAQMNDELSGVETMFMATNNRYSFLSSSLVKEVATYGGDIGRYVPALVRDRLIARLGEDG